MAKRKGKEEDNLPTKAQILTTVERLGKMISESEELDAETEAAISAALSNYQIQFKHFIVALARAKIGRMSNLMEVMDSVEEELYTSDRISRSSTFELLKIRGGVDKSLRSIIDLVMMAKDVDLPVGAGSTTNIFVQNNVQLNEVTQVLEDKDSRENMRNALTGLLRKMGKNGTP